MPSRCLASIGNGIAVSLLIAAVSQLVTVSLKRKYQVSKYQVSKYQVSKYQVSKYQVTTDTEMDVEQIMTAHAISMS